MSSVVEIEKEIEKLPREQLTELREWFGRYDEMASAASTLGTLYDEEEGEDSQWED